MSDRPSDLLTDDEHEAISLLGKAANAIGRIISQGASASNPDCASYDRAEMVGRIHDLQHMVMAQAASRAYPERYRMLGGSFAAPTAKEADGE